MQAAEEDGEQVVQPPVAAVVAEEAEQLEEEEDQVGNGQPDDYSFALHFYWKNVMTAIWMSL